MTAGDQALIDRYLRGDVEAFEELMRAHEDRVFAICLRTLGEREMALDATQETFITVFRKVSQFQGNSAFSTWIYRVAVNTCYDMLRRAKRKQADALPEHVDPPDLAAADELSSVELRPDISAAMAGLPDEFRAAIVLSDLEGLPLSEVSEIIGVPVGTVKSRLFRGRRLLASALGNLRAPSQHPTDEHG